MLDNLDSKQKKILIIVGIVIIIGIIFFIYNKDSNDEKILDENILIEANTEMEENTIKDTENEQIIVHITGAVKVPGIIKLKQGSRIEDAVEQAGGLTEDADISNVNLAYVLEDGVKITIPSNLNIEEQEIITDESGENIIDTEFYKENTIKGKININKAKEDELLTLPGIGIELASRIISYREQNGKFSNIEEIKKVSGIGDSKKMNGKNWIIKYCL